MGLGVGLILSAVGAVLAFAVNTTVSGVNIHTIGWILLIVGIVGILLARLLVLVGRPGLPQPPAHRVRRRGPRPRRAVLEVPYADRLRRPSQ